MYKFLQRFADTFSFLLENPRAGTVSGSTPRVHESPPSALRVVGSRSLVTLALYARQRSVPRATRCWSAQGWRILQDRLIHRATPLH